MKDKFKESKVDQKKTTKKKQNKNQKVQNDKPFVTQADFNSQAEAARYADVSTRTIRAWKSRGMPVIDLGGGKVGYNKQMLDKFKRMNEGDELNKQLKTQEIGFKDVKRQLALIQLKEKQGLLVPVEQVETQQVERILAVKRAMLGMVRKLPPRLKGRSIQQMSKVIRDEVYYILNTFAGKEIKTKRKN